MWQSSEQDKADLQKTEEFCAARGIRPGYRFEDKTDGTCVFSRIGATGRMICHLVGDPDMQSSWAWTLEAFAKHALGETDEPPKPQTHKPLMG